MALSPQDDLQRAAGLGPLQHALTRKVQKLCLFRQERTMFWHEGYLQVQVVAFVQLQQSSM
jgi:hypothetical protein